MTKGDEALKRFLNKKIIALAAVNILLVAMVISCIISCGNLSNTLLTQQAADTWKGQSKDRFSQVSVFFPVNAESDRNGIESFRTQIDKKIAEAMTSVEEKKGSKKTEDDGAADTEIDGEAVERKLWTDTFYATSAINASGERGSFQATAVGVEGDFFLFHPYELLSGSYIYDTDIMKDRVVLDYDLAWKLFGSAALEGMTVKINNHPYYIAGVVRRETDKFSQKCFSGEPMIFMFHSALEKEVGGEDEALGVSGYEIVMADPITGFVKNFVTESLGTNAMVVENTARYNFSSIYSIFKNFGTRSLKTDAVVCPYWENAARMSEVHIARLWVVGALLSIIPLITLIWLLVILIRFLVRKMKQGKKAAFEAWDDRYGRMENLRNRRAAKKLARENGELKPKKQKKSRRLKRSNEESEEAGEVFPEEVSEETGEEVGEKVVEETEKESLETFWKWKREEKPKPVKEKKAPRRKKKSPKSAPQVLQEDTRPTPVEEYFSEKEVSEDVERIVREFMEENNTKL